MKQILPIVILMMSLNSYSQEEDNSDWRLYHKNKTDQTQKAPDSVVGDVPVRDRGEIRYIQDERIAVVDEYLKSNPIKQDGYRIQLIFGSRSEVSSARSRFLAQWRYSAYETYLAPNFRLRVGDFMNRWQAEKALRSLKTKFPNAYIVRDKIETPNDFR